MKSWLIGQPNIEVLYVPYHEVITHPINQAERVNSFLNNSLDTQKMLESVDKKLYRNKKKSVNSSI